MQNNSKVVVVGAGLSGLTAADKLLTDNTQTGVQVIVLEAMDRVGGRTQTIDLDGGKFDLGGQWVGKTQKFVQELAKRSGNQLIPQWHKGSKILDLKSHVSIYTSNIPLNVGIIPLIHMQLNLWKLDRMANKLDNENPRNNNVLAVLWDSQTVQSWIHQNIWFEKVRLLFECAIRAVLGVETNEVSFLFFLWYIRQNGGIENLINIENGLQEMKMKHGSQFLSEYLRKNVEKLGGKVLTSCPVSQIVKNSKGYLIKYGNDEIVECDFVVIAMPPARVTRIRFEPQLSRERRMICEKNFMGSITKVHLLYHHMYWRESGFSGETLSDCLQTPIFNAYDDTKVKQNGQLCPAILVFINASVDREWSCEQNRREAEKNIVETLAKYFKSEKMLSPKLIHWKSWNEEPSLNGGPIAAFPPGVLTKIQDIRKPEGGIHWAGTQMARFSQGFMDGAIESGLRVANQIEQEIHRAGEKRKQEIQSTPKSRWFSKIMEAKPKWLEWV